MQKALITILLLGGLLLLESCIKTYPGNDMPSLKKPHNILVGGWDVTNYLINELEVLDSLRTFYGPCWGQLKFSESLYYDNFRMYGDGCFLAGVWGLSNEKSIYLRMGKVYDTLAPIQQPATGLQYAFLTGNTWEIYQLEKDKFEFHCEFQSTIQKMIAVKVED